MNRNQKSFVKLGLFLLIALSFINADFHNTNRYIQKTNQDNVLFVKAKQTLGDTRTFGLATGDVDQDGDNDIFIANYHGFSKLWLNKGDGTFIESNQNFNIYDGTPEANSAHDAKMADLNGDSFPDLIIISHGGPNKIYFNDGKGNFNESDQRLSLSEKRDNWISLHDVDADGDIDAFTYSNSGPCRLWLNDGNGFFKATKEEYGGTDAKGSEIADLNGDSLPDLIILMRNKPNQIWLNDGLSKFVNSGKTVDIDGNDIECEDCNGDGKIDIVITDIDGGLRVWINQDNNGTFSRKCIIDEGGLKCKLIDVDLDGDFDLITANPDEGNKLWLNDGYGTFKFSGQMFGMERVLSIGYSDINGDGDYDIILGQKEGTNGNAIYFNQLIVK